MAYILLSLPLSPSLSIIIAQYDSPLEGKGRGHMSISPTVESQSSTHQTCSKISTNTQISMIIFTRYCFQKFSNNAIQGLSHFP